MLKKRYNGRMKRLFRYLLLPTSAGEDIARREYILNILLVGIIIFSTTVGIAFLIQYFYLFFRDLPTPGGSPVITIAFILLFWFLLFLSKKGFHRVVAYAFISTIFIASVYSLFSWGVVNAQGLLLLVFVIIMSGILVGTRMAFGILTISFFTLFTLSYLQINSIIETDLSRNGVLGYEDTVAYIITFAVIALVSWLFNKEIEKSLRRAKRSEKELKEERDNLEIKVEERTSELKKTQMEKTMHLYKFAEFGRMTSGLFHDLVNPLTAVYLNLENLKKKGDTKVLFHIDNALKNIERVKDIITAGRAQIQKQEISTTFSIEDEITRALQMLSFKAKKANVVFDVIPYSTAEMYGSSLKFYRLIICLISNAIDAYKSVTCDKNNRKIVIAFCQKDHLIRILIQDWGCGIKEQHKEKIFDPFFTTKNAEEGTGIGLSICKEIIEKDFNGSITVKSEEGKGATFAIDFPVSSIN